jgi:hypothetical protein
MNLIIDENQEIARARLLQNEVRPTTFVLAALIFGVAGVSALWLLVLAGLAALCSLVVVVVLGVAQRALTRPRNNVATSQMSN